MTQLAPGMLVIPKGSATVYRIHRVMDTTVSLQVMDEDGDWCNASTVKTSTLKNCAVYAPVISSKPLSDYEKEIDRIKAENAELKQSLCNAEKQIDLTSSFGYS